MKMNDQPTNRISEKGLYVWRLYGAIQTACLMILAIILCIITSIFGWPWWIYVVSILVCVIYAYLFVFLFPKIRWLRWRYEVRESEIELQYGLFVVKRVLIPMVRVQHVNMMQGPILRKNNLAGITISTAATNHVIPVLVTEEADELRGRISALARVAEDDV